MGVGGYELESFDQRRRSFLTAQLKRETFGRTVEMSGKLQNEVESLRPPFVVLEFEGDPELFLFSELNDILSDRFDCLWNERYQAWDSSGRRFYLRRVIERDSWFRRILGLTSERVVVESVAPGPVTGAIWPRVLHLAENVLHVEAPDSRMLSELNFRELLDLTLRAQQALSK